MLPFVEFNSQTFPSSYGTKFQVHGYCILVKSTSSSSLVLLSIGARMCDGHLISLWIPRRHVPVPSHFHSCSVKLRTPEHRTRQAMTALDLGGTPSSGDDGSEENDLKNSEFGSTRLGRIIKVVKKELVKKLKETRKTVPLKVFFLLLGYYSANAIATLVGQTGDWDIFVVGIIVAMIEGIGALMYRIRPHLKKFQIVIIMLNYWKAGLSLGLFLDKFKLWEGLFGNEVGSEPQLWPSTVKIFASLK